MLIVQLRETQLWNFCNEIKETIWLFFWKCNIVKNLWLEMAEILKKKKKLHSWVSLNLHLSRGELSLKLYAILCIGKQ
jgi:hypothetical protein